MRANQTINPKRANEGVLVHLKPGDDFHVKESGVPTQGGSHRIGVKWGVPLLAWGVAADGRRYGFRVGQTFDRVVDQDFGPSGGVTVGDAQLKSDRDTLRIKTYYHSGGTHSTTLTVTLTVANLLKGSGIKQKAPTGPVTIDKIEYLYVPDAPNVDCVTVVGDSVLGMFDQTTRELFWPYAVQIDHTLTPCVAGSNPADVEPHTVYLNGLNTYGDEQTLYFQAPTVMSDFRLAMTPLMQTEKGPKELAKKSVLFAMLGSAMGYWTMTFKWRVDPETGTVYITIHGINNQGNALLAQWTPNYQELLGTIGVAFVVEPESLTVAGLPFKRLMYPSTPTAPPLLPVAPCQPGTFYVKSSGVTTEVSVPLNPNSAHPRPPYTEKLTVRFVPYPSATGRAQSAGVVVSGLHNAKKPLEMKLVTEGQRTTVYAVLDGKRLKGAALPFYGASLAELGKGYYEVDGPVCAPPGATFSAPADEPITPPPPAPTPSGGGGGSLVLPLAAGGALLVWALSRR